MESNPTFGQVANALLDELRNILNTRFSLSVDKEHTIILHNFILEEAGNKLGAFLGTIVPHDRPVSLDLPVTAEEQNKLQNYFEQLCLHYLAEDPDTNGILIDDISGYMRDGRVHDSQAEAAGNLLRLRFKAEDKKNLYSSDVPATFYDTSGQKDIEHVLEISVVAHMINHPTFIQRAHERGVQKLQSLDALAQLAEALKEKENLVKDAPQQFNLDKAQFFMGNTVLSIPLALYLEERSKIQRDWIDRNATRHGNRYVRFVFEELVKTRFAQGYWYQLIGSLWFVKMEKDKNAM